MRNNLKVGNKVKIKSLDWYNKLKDTFGEIYIKSKIKGYSNNFNKEMSKFCEKKLTIKEIKFCNACGEDHFELKEDLDRSIFVIGMFDIDEQLEFNFSKS